MKNRLLPLLILFVLTIIWGSSFILIKKGLIGFDPLEVGVLRIFFAYVVAIPFALKYYKVYLKDNWKTLAAYGLMANLIPGILFALAETGMSSSLTGILNSTTPIFTLLIGALFFSTAIKSKQVIGLTISFAGSAILSFIGSGGEIGSFNYHALYVIAATILYGYTANLVKTKLSHVDSVPLTTLALFTIGPLTFTYILFSDIPAKVAGGGGAITALLYIFLLGAFGTTFALMMFNKLIHMTTAVFATTITYLIPIMAVIWGVIDGEAVYAIHFAGMILVIFGVYLINKFK